MLGPRHPRADSGAADATWYVGGRGYDLVDGSGTSAKDFHIRYGGEKREKKKKVDSLRKQGSEN